MRHYWPFSIPDNDFKHGLSQIVRDPHQENSHYSRAACAILIIFDAFTCSQL
jgi:hypothetical protein